jgi:hypothetical protein
MARPGSRPLPEIAQMFAQAVDHYRQGRLDEAERIGGRLRKLLPDNFEALHLLGLVKLGRGHAGAALGLIEAALKIDPGAGGAWSNRGLALATLDRDSEALASFDQALALAPDDPDTLNNRGSLLLKLARPADALAALDRVGDYRGGFARHEMRLRRSGMPAYRRFGKPLWLGEYPLHRKTILLHAEQGLGDTIQFARYAPLLARRGAKVVLEVPAELATLLRRLDGVAGVVARGAPLPGFDVHCPMGSLPLALATEPATIPAEIPYLAASPERIAAWRPRLAALASPRVAIAWSGRAAHPNDRNRSLALSRLEPLLDLDQVSFISAQREVSDPDAATLAAMAHITAIGAELRDFDDTAAVLALADLVITVDTSVAHLAGATGRPTWILLPFAPDWRWMLGRDDSPWYPTARLYRQPASGDWESVIARVREDLAEMAEG